jgi:hypothetical protein
MRNAPDMTVTWYILKIQILFFTLNVFYAKNSHHIIKQLNNANADHLTQELMALVSLSQTYVMAQTKFIIH